MMVRRMKLLCSLVMMLASHSALAVSYPLPPEGSRLVGSPMKINVPSVIPSRWKPLPRSTGRG